MKKIIDGKRYDTERAELITEYANMPDRRNFRYFTEALHRTASGNWFLTGETHGLSPYGEACGTTRFWGSDLRPMTPEEAQAWLEKRNQVKVLEEFFGDQITDA